jgi:signal peptidase II
VDSVVVDGRVPLTASRRWALAALLAAGSIAADQLAKAWAVATLDTRTIGIVGDLQLRLVYNYDGAFGVGSGSGRIIGFFVVVVVGFLVAMLRQPRSVMVVSAIGLLVGGAAGNLIDRVVRDGPGLFGGGVVDFIDPQWWPVFNVADIVVGVGIGLMILSSLLEDRRARRAEAGAGE